MAVLLSERSVDNPRPRSGRSLIQLSTCEWAGEVSPGRGPVEKSVLSGADHDGGGEGAHLINRQKHPQLSVRGEHGSHQKRICPVRLKRGFLVLLISACIRRVPRMVIALSFNLPESPSWHSSSSFPDTHSTPGPRQSWSLTSPLDYPAGKE